MKMLAILIAVSVYLVSGCVEQYQNVPVSDHPAEPVYNNSVVPEYSPVVDMAKNDLSLRLKIPVDEITLVQEEAVDWPDSSLGFPEKGMYYAQVITPGFRIILKAGDKIFEYHSSYNRIAGPQEIS